MSWLADIKRDELIDDAERIFRAAGEKYAQITINPTRIAPWKDWTSFIGLGLDGIPGATDLFLPDATARIGAELALIGAEVGYGQFHAAATLIDALSARCPYLDRGADYRALAGVIGVADRTDLSPILSRAIRALRDTGHITLDGGGDSTGALTLGKDVVNAPEAVGRISIARPNGANA